MKLKKAIAVFLILAISAMGCIAVYAETWTETPTHEGKTVTCTIAVDWNLFSPDIADAYTSFTASQLPNHKAKVKLERQQNYNGAWETLDTATADDNTPGAVHVSGTGSGVWQFRSSHYVVHTTGDKSTILVTQITEW